MIDAWLELRTSVEKSEGERKVVFFSNTDVTERVPFCLLVFGLKKFFWHVFRTGRFFGALVGSFAKPHIYGNFSRYPGLSSVGSEIRRTGVREFEAIKKGVGKKCGRLSIDVEDCCRVRMFDSKISSWLRDSISTWSSDREANDSMRAEGFWMGMQSSVRSR